MELRGERKGTREEKSGIQPAGVDARRLKAATPRTVCEFLRMAILTSDLRFKADSTPFIAKSFVSAAQLSVLMINTARCLGIKLK